MLLLYFSVTLSLNVFYIFVKFDIELTPRLQNGVRWKKRVSLMLHVFHLEIFSFV